MSSGALLLPSVNRGVPRVVAQSLSGIVAYAYRYSIYFIDARYSPPLILDSKFLFKAHTGKIISLSFCKQEGTELLASISENREIKVWNVETKTCLVTAEVRECTRVSEWIYGSSNILIYPVDCKSIVKWDFEKGLNGISKIKSGSDATVTQLVSNAKSPHLLAIGYMNGLITLIDIAKETVLQKLKIHSMEISSLSWSPIVPDNLFSTSLDLSLRMWKVGESQPLWSYYMQAARQKYEDKRKLRIAGICHPTNSNAVICSNLRGDVGEVVYSETEKPKFSFYYQGSCDLNCKSTFVFFLVTMEEGKTDLLYCFDPFKVTLWNVTEKRLSSQLPFMSQFVYDLTVSSVNPNLLAISNGEGILKVWNSLSETTKMDIISVYVHFKTRIMTAAWHPTSENIIAYATDEGRVGVIDIYKRKPVYSFETHHSGAIYSLSWAPCEKVLKTDHTDGGKTAFFIYSCGGGIIYINQENDAKGKARNFDELVERPADLDTTEKTHSELSWRSDFSCLCVGSFKGYIDVYNNTFVFLMRFNVQMKTVECLRWHPESTYMSPDGSNLKSWLACSGNDEEIHIVDTSSHQEQSNGSQGVVKKLVGHNKRVVSLCWSQHKDGFLVSASKDGSALVWDVLSGTIIATYLSHQDVVFAVQWSVFDQDVIYSGGQDGSVRIWKISEQTVSAPPSKAPRRKKLKKPTAASTKKTNGNNSEEDTDVEENNVEINIKGAKTSLSESSVAESVQTLIEEENVTTSFFLAAQPQVFPSKKYLLFPYHTPSKAASSEDLDDCIKLADILSENPYAKLDRTGSFDSLKSSPVLNNEEVIKFGMFTDQLTAMRMVETQSDLLKSAGDLNNAWYLQLMAGNIQSVLEEATKTRSLNFFLVSIAPSVSHSFWLKMCEKFAEQLFEQRRFTEASFYYLTCGKIYEAINVLTEKGNIIDALALAKARLPESDPLIPQLLIRARKKYFSMRNILGETKCFMSMNQPLAAAKAMASSNDPNYIRVAAYICKKFQLDREAEDYRFLCMEKCLANFNYSAFKLLVKQEPCMQVYNALMSVHEALHHHIKLLKKSNGIAMKELFCNLEEGSEIQFWKGSTCIDSKQSFISYVHQHLFSEELLNTDKSTLSSLLDALDILSSKKNTFGTAEAHVTIAIYIFKFIILSLLQDVDVGTIVFLKIFDASYNIAYLSKIMCSLFFPMCLSWKKDTSQMHCTSVILEEALNYNVIFEAIYNNLCEKITCYMKQPIETFIMSEDLQNNLRFITDRIAIILDTKKVQEHLLAYFVSSVINELTRCIEKKDLKLKCYKTPTVKEKSSTLINMQTEQYLETNTVTYENSNSFSENTEEAVVINELINLAIREAEEKANSFTEQDTIPVNETPTHVKEDLSSGEIQVENSSDIVATNISSVVVVQCSSQIDGSLNSASIINVSNSVEKITSKIDNNISKNEEKIEDSLVMSDGDISSEKNDLPSDEYKISNNDIILDVVLSNNKCLVSEGDATQEMDVTVDKTVTSENVVSEENIIPNNESAVSNGDTILEEEGLPRPTSNNTMVPEVVELFNSELLNIISEEKAAPNNELLFHNNGIIPEEVDNPKNKAPEGDNLPQNELIISNTDIVPVKSKVPNTELDLPNSGLILGKLDQPNNENVVSDDSILHEELILPPNKHVVLNNGVHENILPVNEDVVSNNIIASEALIQPSMKNDIQDENEDLKEHIHKQCLENIDGFYNIISFIAQNICKDEFALLFYLKERVKFLYQARATEELDKFSKEKKANSKNSTGTKKIDSTTDSLKSKTSEEKEDSCVSENNDSSLKPEESVGPSSEICLNDVDKITTLGIQSLEGKEVEKMDGPDSNSHTSAVDTNEMLEKVENICEEHNYCSPKESGENALVSHASSNKISEDVDMSPAGSVTRNLQNELEEISELVCILEKKLEKFCYPNPFDVIPKILRALYDVAQKSPCKCVQEKLHLFIHDIVSWAERYAVGEINFVCPICQKTSVM